MLNRLILYLIRKKLGVKKYQHFRFANQKSEAVYEFTDEFLLKNDHRGWYVSLSGVSLNWLLDDECKVEIVKEE